MNQFFPIQTRKKRNQLFIGLLSLLPFVAGFNHTSLTNAKMNPHFSALAIEPLLNQKQISQKQRGVREGQVILTGEQGQYTGKMIVRASPAIAWAVLTDYDNYEKFLPDVAESNLVENNGNNKIFEQVKIIQAAIFSRRSKIRIAVTETYPKKIAFRMTSGKIKSLQGSWTIQPLSRPNGNMPIQLLITHQVEVDPGNVSWRGIFYGIYEDSLEETLQAISKEINRRAQINQ